MLFAVLKIFSDSGPVRSISPSIYKKMFPNAVCSENMKTEEPVFSLITDENKMLVIRICVVLLDLDVSHRSLKKKLPKDNPLLVGYFLDTDMWKIQEHSAAPHNSVCVELCTATDVSTAAEFTKICQRIWPRCAIELQWPW